MQDDHEQRISFQYKMIMKNKKDVDMLHAGNNEHKMVLFNKETTKFFRRE